MSIKRCLLVCKNLSCNLIPQAQTNLIMTAFKNSGGLSVLDSERVHKDR